MFYVEYLARFLRHRLSPNQLIVRIASSVLLGLLFSFASPSTLLKAQQLPSLTREFDTADSVTLTVKNRDGRVTVVASEDFQKKAKVEAKSAGAMVMESDVAAKASGNKMEVDV